MLSLDFFGKYFIYLKERLPVLPTLLFSASYGALAVGLVNNVGGKMNTIIVFSGIFFFFLLRLRVTDEFKDENHDRTHYPNRPLQRGLVSKRDLISIGAAALLVELFLAYLVSGIRYYLPVVIYSILMSFEFFIPRFLDKHFTIYFLTHEVVFIFYSLFFLLALKANTTLFSFWLSLVVLICFPISVEIIRKFSPRKDSVGKEVADSYSKVWGRKVSLHSLSILMVLVGLAAAVINNNLLIMILTVGCFGALVTFIGNKDKNVIVIAAAYLVLISLLVNL